MWLADLVADGCLAGEIIQQHGDEGRLCHDGGVGGDGAAGDDVRARAVATRRAATRTNTLRCQTQSHEKIELAFIDGEQSREPRREKNQRKER